MSQQNPKTLNHVLQFKTELMKAFSVFFIFLANSFIYKDKYTLCKIGTAHMKICKCTYTPLSLAGQIESNKTQTQGRAVFNCWKSTLEVWVTLTGRPTQSCTSVPTVSVCISTHCGKSTLHPSKRSCYVFFNYVVSCLQRTALQNCCKHLVRRAAFILGSERPILTSQLQRSRLWLCISSFCCMRGKLKGLLVCSVRSLDCHRLLKGLFRPNIHRLRPLFQCEDEQAFSTFGFQSYLAEIPLPAPTPV